MTFGLDSLLSRQSNIGQSRSSVLNPLQWMTVIIVGGLASFVYGHAQDWLIILMAVLLSLTFALFAGGFIYFMLRQPDTLRSEDFVLASKMIDKDFFPPKIAKRLIAQEKKIKSGQGVHVEDAKTLKRTSTRSSSSAAAPKESK